MTWPVAVTICVISFSIAFATWAEHKYKDRD